MKTSHSLKYINDIKNKKLDINAQKKIGFPINDSVVRRSFVATGGTVLASKLALDSKLACNTAGGSHHATFDFGAGYCVFNDTAVAANYLKNKGYAQRILILDLDVHQGDGTIDICQGDPQIFTCSIHSESNFPFEKKKGWMDIGLPTGTNDQSYLVTLSQTLDSIHSSLTPDLILFDAGIDVYTNDGLGNLELSIEGIRKRDQLVFEHFRGRGIPVATVIGGGYSQDRQELASRHGLIFESAINYL